MVLGSWWSSGSLARRYMVAALCAALLPLLTISILYDRYAADLIHRISDSRIEGETEAVAARMGSFLAGQMNRLENIADLPATAAFLRAGVGQPIDDAYFDFLLLEAESPEVYSIALLDHEERLVVAAPAGAGGQDAIPVTAPFVRHAGTDIIGPILPDNGRPGWVVIRMPVTVNHEPLGFVMMRLRLASLTEQMAPLSLSGIRSPQLVVFDRQGVAATGVPAAAGDVLQSSAPILPGWRVQLVADAGRLDAPRQNLRLTLLLLAALLAAAMGALFVQMSRRLSGYLRPLRDGADAVSHGDFATPVPENGPGELGSLARAFNHMRRQLREMINSRVDAERRGALGDMAAGIAHEVRNPLATVSTTIYGMKRGEPDPDRLYMYDEISDEIERVDRTIEAFLRYARPAAPVRARVAVREVFRSLRTLTAARLMDQGITMNLAGESRLEFEIDPTHLRQILLNLVLNAVEAMPNGGVISLTVLRQGGDVVLTVADTGTGMDAQTLDKVLQPFFTTRAGGSGLGLAVTAELVHNNDGSMDIDSRPGKGTVVTLTFPARKGEAEK